MNRADERMLEFFDITGQEISFILDDLHILTTELAKFIGVHRTTINNWVNSSYKSRKNTLLAHYIMQFTANEAESGAGLRYKLFIESRKKYQSLTRKYDDKKAN